MISTSVTSAELAALLAVKRGLCYRIYHTKGNTMHGRNNDAGPRERRPTPGTLWRLANAGWIDDDPHGVLGNRVTLMLTRRGEVVLAEHLKPMMGRR